MSGAGMSLELLGDSFQPGLCAEDLFGPIQVEPYKTELREIASVFSSDLVDDFFGTYEAQARVKTVTAARELLVKGAREYVYLQAKCNLLEKVQLTTTMAKFFYRNRRQIKHHRLISAPFEIPKGLNQTPLEKFSPTQQAFRDKLLDIKSIAAIPEDIENLFNLMADLKTSSSTKFFSFHYLVFKVFGHCCSEEEAIKFWHSFEVMRQSKTVENVNELLAKIQTKDFAEMTISDSVTQKGV
ncbi:hypothetical protein HDU83_004093 [Entophlyctis luteolus]|nr:hypothetical protein HDU83_004093 [Entophlyctis luteolus]